MRCSPGNGQDQPARPRRAAPASLVADALRPLDEALVAEQAREHEQSHHRAGVARVQVAAAAVVEAAARELLRARHEAFLAEQQAAAGARRGGGRRDATNGRTHRPIRVAGTGRRG